MTDAPASLLSRVRRRLTGGAGPWLPPLPDGRAVARWVVPVDELARVDAMPLRDLGHGYDAYGMSRGGLAFGLALSHVLYHHWFRVSSHGIGHLPTTGPVVVVANHSGTLPLDGLMICADILRRSPVPRVPRAVVDYFVGRMPVVNTVFTRAGAIGGSRANFHDLLDHGEVIVVFPEGTAGIGKGWDKRYELQRWTHGHAELALRHGATIVPLAVIGAEEQLPQLGRLAWLHAFGAPFLPIPASPLPLPVHLHLWYGPPIRVAERWSPDDAHDPEVVAQVAAQSRAAVHQLIHQGLRARTGVFA